MSLAVRASRLAAGVAAAATTAVVSAAVLAPPAHAGPTGAEETPGGYGVGAGSSITLSGDYSPARRASVPSPPPLCWWTVWSEAPKDAQAAYDWWTEEIAPSINGSFAMGRLAMNQERLEASLDADEPITWYRLSFNEAALAGLDYEERNQRLVDAGCTSSTRVSHYLGPFTILQSYNWFTDRQGPPAPVFDPRVLAEYAYEVMDLVQPELDWNPKMTAGQASLVNLSTWLWVQDSAAVSDRSVTASAGGVSATVTATTDGLSVASPGGTTQCTSDQARTAWSAGADEGQACTLEFFRASFGYPRGFPVDASTVWSASWTSSTGDGGDLAGRTEYGTTLIPVAESQALVTSAGR